MAELESRGKKRRPLTIEDYLDFIDSGGQLDLSRRKLNQIIGMHGFKRLGSEKKGLLMEAVSKLELMDLTRSTKEDDDVSPLAHVTLKEAMRGLKDLSWEECHVSSLITLNALACKSSVQNDAVPAKRKRQGKKTRKLLNNQDLGNGDEVTSAGTTVSAAGANAEDTDSPASLFGRELRELVPTKKKRSPRVEFRCC